MKYGPIKLNEIQLRDFMVMIQFQHWLHHLQFQKIHHQSPPEHPPRRTLYPNQIKTSLEILTHIRTFIRHNIRPSNIFKHSFAQYDLSRYSFSLKIDIG